MNQYENITKIVPKYIPYEPRKKREAYQVIKETDQNVVKLLPAPDDKFEVKKKVRPPKKKRVKTKKSASENESHLTPQEAKVDSSENGLKSPKKDE